MSPRSHILVTNDDGISSPLLRALAFGLAETFRVTVVAPLHEQSWIGRAYSRHRELAVCPKLLDRGSNEIEAWTVDGTPSDAVNVALGHLLTSDPPAAVVSGFNAGYNCTMPLLMSSGTFAAAIEGAHWGLPAAALSMALFAEEYQAWADNRAVLSEDLKKRLALAVAHAVTFVRNDLSKNNPPLHDHNLNYPATLAPETQTRSTQPLVTRQQALFQPEPCGTRYRFRYPGGKAEALPETTDAGCLQSGHISHSILDVSRFGS